MSLDHAKFIDWFLAYCEFHSKKTSDVAVYQVYSCKSWAGNGSLFLWIWMILGRVLARGQISHDCNRFFIHPGFNHRKSLETNDFRWLNQRLIQKIDDD